uniref:Tumor necrosis factor receptor superfamily, member 6b n=1 Tax=Triakis scyllium TaxID=30494 RepID=A5A7P1_TRISC|nr:tumor necrosis factor receptor superfamily, member 6b [Triakis scyllium]
MIFKCVISILLIENVRSFWLETVKPTYKRRDAITGQMVTCEQCPPGTFVKEHCTSIQPTMCERCPDLHYTQYWNYLQKCRYCNVFCVDYQYEKHQCNSTHNRVCECQPGYYLEFEFCLKQSSCPYGAGVIKMGTPYSDTNCEPCSHGYFSPSVSSSEPCFIHTNCTKEGLEVNVPGNQYHDTLCTSCKKYDASGILDDSALSPCNEAIIQFVAYQKIPLKKLTRFLSLLQIEEAKKLSKELRTHNKHMMHEKLRSSSTEMERRYQEKPSNGKNLANNEKSKVEECCKKCPRAFYA